MHIIIVYIIHIHIYKSSYNGNEGTGIWRHIKMNVVAVSELNFEYVLRYIHLRLLSISTGKENKI